MISVYILKIIFIGLQAFSAVENFNDYGTGVWRQGATYNNWILKYHGYGQVGIQSDSSQNKFLFQRPRASKALSETSASLALSRQEFKDVVINLKSRVVKQLRTPRPNPWETAWVLWNYKHDHRFYYFALKTNGWELGKVDNTKINPSGPSCLWPQYLNCRYPGAQRFLRTGSFPRTKVGQWDNVRVEQEGNKFVVFVNNSRVVSFTDNERPYMTGQVGLYNEDAHVNFDDVQIFTR